MARLEFEGKQHIYAHHMTVPIRPLVPDAAKSFPPPGAGTSAAPDGNLIIHGDNLLALKSLLPRYEGRVNCVYIDPPYNTGNENWVYNDKVNSPLMRAWLAENGSVEGEDMLRHDKWLCMMWPRLHLLRDLLADDGIIFVSIDDNEQHRLRMLMDEIFGEENFINCFAWVGNLKGRQIGESGAAKTYEQILAYAKDLNEVERWEVNARFATELMPDAYRMQEYDVLTDEHGEYVIKNELYNTNRKFNEETAPTLVFNIHYRSETGEFRFSDIDSGQNYEGFTLIPPKQNSDGTHRFHAWRWSRDKISNESYNLHVKRRGGTYRIYTKVRNFTTTTLKDLLTNISSSDNTLGKIGVSFPTPKPVDLLKVLVGAVASNDALILDSFAGSGTTAHAVLALNKEDGGNRRFILVECKDYADALTAERVRRVIRGVPGARDAALRDGLGGSFAYCELGGPIDTEAMLTGEGDLPSYEAFAAHLLHTATGESAGEASLAPKNDDGLFHSTETTDYYLLYEPDVDWLEGEGGILRLSGAKRIRDALEASRTPGGRRRKAVVFGVGRYIKQEDLTPMGVEFCQIPYETRRGA